MAYLYLFVLLLFCSVISLNSLFLTSPNDLNQLHSSGKPVWILSGHNKKQETAVWIQTYRAD